MSRVLWHKKQKKKSEGNARRSIFDWQMLSTPRNIIQYYIWRVCIYLYIKRGGLVGTGQKVTETLTECDRDKDR